jgi:hypothetical protein
MSSQQQGRCGVGGRGLDSFGSRWDREKINSVHLIPKLGTFAWFRTRGLFVFFTFNKFVGSIL